MPAAVDFYFDFSSPYGYFASTRIDELAARHGRHTTWRPILLGPVFKAVGTSPLVSYPIKGRYVAHDFARFARLLGVPFAMPANFPFGAVAASRAFYWIDDRDKAQAKAFAQAVFRAGLGEGGDVTPVETVANLAAKAGVDRAALLAALADPTVKQRLVGEVDHAMQRGVFGSPTVVVDGEMFWGADRLDQVDRWLATGGW
ncbi:MAG TPA: 2-hydroxychromene-2-carboxylate isomerase [Alphaproteobacteria bacterium]|nr:2-hydroxychromene-2-carboxylate isomerase [Alphaproteobacteria bacterium]